LANAAKSWHVPASPAVVTEDLRFTNGDAQLFGTVYLPQSGDRLPAVVVLHDASIPNRQAALYRHLSEGLPAMGIAVLIYDRRATGQSSGSRENITLTALAEDGIAGQRALSKVTRIDPNKIGFWGFTRGGSQPERGICHLCFGSAHISRGANAIRHEQPYDDSRFSGQRHPTNA